MMLGVTPSGFRMFGACIDVEQCHPFGVKEILSECEKEN
jgi:hypothetical protein